MSTHEYRDRVGKSQKSQFVLSISNWHFVRDNLELKNSVECKTKDVVVAIKLSSTTFKPVSVSQPVLDEDGDEVEDLFYFDRNGLQIPYPLFIHLLNQVEFTVDFLGLVKSEFEKHGRVIMTDDAEDFDDSIEREELTRKKFEDNEKLREAEEERALMILEGRLFRDSDRSSEPERKRSGPQTPSGSPSSSPAPSPRHGKRVCKK